MIRDYKSGSGLRGALGSLIGEHVVAAQCVDNTIILFFETRSAVCIRAKDYGIVSICPLNGDDVSAYVKALVRDADQRQADLDLTIQMLGDQKCAKKSKTCYVNTEDCTTSA